MQGRTLAEDRPERLGLHRRDLGGIEVAEAALEFKRTAEGLLDRDLLIEREADQQCQRLLGEETVGIGIPGIWKRVGSAHGRMVDRLADQEARKADASRSNLPTTER